MSVCVQAYAVVYMKTDIRNTSAHMCTDFVAMLDFCQARLMAI